MRLDPYTLRVALDKQGAASGELYTDDGNSFAHEQGEFVWRGLKASTEGKTIKITSYDKAKTTAVARYSSNNTFAKSHESVRVEKLVVMGLPGAPTGVSVAGTELDWEYIPGLASAATEDGPYSVLIVKNPVASITKDWEVVIRL